ncbi:MAG TPA: hypothetical protein VMT57_08510 [Candidatus Thermoplasmatota archaeon]|nr:hypothetical protein [Candidatus Thermoplasmatota archaeon]
MHLWNKYKKKFHLKTSTAVSSSEDAAQSLPSWVQKIEQSTNSVSARLTAVEMRLTGGFTSAGEKLLSVNEGPVERFFTEKKSGKKKTLMEHAKALDQELFFVIAELEKRKQKHHDLEVQVQELERSLSTMQHDLREMEEVMTPMREMVEKKAQLFEQRKPLMMKLGAVEIPVEVTGIIGGLLAFSVAILVALDQKAVLLSPVFLAAVGMLLLGSALVKTIRLRSRATKKVHKSEATG